MGKHGKYRALVGASAALILFAGLANAAPCRQALAMGLDVSGSVDADEYRLQLDGLVAALTSPEVSETLLSMPQAPVRLAVYEWSAPDFQRMLLPWTDITNGSVLNAIVSQLSAVERIPAGPSTALGLGMTYGVALLSEHEKCWKRTLDISGDGRANTGPRPQDVSDQPAFDGITINALVIGNGGEANGDLDTYFRTLVISGPDAFTEQAHDFASYEQAMIRKLLRELQGLAVSEWLDQAVLPPMSHP